MRARCAREHAPVDGGREKRGGKKKRRYLVRRKTSLGRYCAKPRAPEPRGTMVTLRRGSACCKFQPEERGHGRAGGGGPEGVRTVRVGEARRGSPFSTCGTAGYCTRVSERRTVPLPLPPFLSLSPPLLFLPATACPAS